MCDALMELFKEELEESKSIGLQQGIELGIEQIIRNVLRKGHTPEQISHFVDVSLEEVLAVQMTMTEEKVEVCTVTRFNWDDMEVAKECGRVIEISDGCIL